MKAVAQAQDAYNQGIQAQQNNNLDQAITLYQKAIAESPNESAYPYALGTAYQAKGDMDNAISSYEKRSLFRLKTLITKKSILPPNN